MIKWFQCEQADWWVDGWERNRERRGGETKATEVYISKPGGRLRDGEECKDGGR